MLHCHLSHSNNAMLWMADSYKKRGIHSLTGRERESEQRHESNTVKREVETTEEKKSMGGRWGEVKEGGVELESGGKLLLRPDVKSLADCFSSPQQCFSWIF